MKLLIAPLLLLYCLSAQSQIKNIFQKEIDATRFEPATVLDSTYGIIMYNKYAGSLGGDSIRNCAGYSCQGFKEDFYVGEALLHKGFYENGKVSFFKNYYPNGTLEREYKNIDVFKGRLITYWPDGKLKSDGIYIDGNTLKYTEYFENGQIFITETMNKSMDYYVESKSFFENGHPSALLILVNPKKLQFEKSEYSENGKLRVKGELFYSKAALEYKKTGKWMEYNEDGSLSRETEYEDGAIVKQKNY